jgi:hypothetical protein
MIRADVFAAQTIGYRDPHQNTTRSVRRRCRELVRV